MSDPRLLLAELEATELLLRTLAIENLDYRGVLEVERIAHRSCAELLARFGGAPAPEPRVQAATRWEPSSNVPLVEEATDELLTGAVVAVAATAVGADTADLIEFDGELEVLPESERDDPTDETPASSSEVMLRWNHEGRPALMGTSDLPPAGDPMLDDEDPTLADGSSIQSAVEAAQEFELETPPAEVEVEVAEEEELVELAENFEEEPLSSEHEGDPSWVEQPSAQPSYVSEDRWEAPPEAPPSPPTAGGGDPWAHLVTFATPESEEATGEEGTADTDSAHDDPWAEQRLVDRERATVSRPPARPAVLEPGTDALATMDNRVSRDDLLPDVEPELDEIEELELESEAPAEVGGLDESAFEEDATLIRAAPAEPIGGRVSTPAPAPSRPPAPRMQGTPIGGTAGLYGSAAVPTIRDSDDPRPRAAAIQLNAAGTGGRMLGAEEEDEPIEIGEASADEIEENGGDGGGFSLKVQEYEEEEVEEEEEEYEEEEEEAPLEPDPEPEPVGPTAEELRGLLGAAQAAASSGNLQGGADLYTDLIDQDPDNVEAHVARGRLYLDLGDYSRAMSDFMVAEDLANTDPEPQVAIGDLYFARKDYRKAIEYFDQALLLAPNHAMAFCRRGISHYYRKNYPDAVTDLEKAKKLDPEIANIGTYISMARKKVGK